MSYEEALTWQEAEELATQHLVNMGYRDVRRMPDGPDGGVDVVGEGVSAQVKHWATPVGIAEVQRHRGAVLSGDAVFFALSGYTSAATTWSEERGVALFRYDHAQNVYPANSVAEMLVTPTRLHDGDDAFEYRRAVGDFVARKRRHDAAWLALVTASAEHFKPRPDLFTPDLERRFMAMVHAEQGFNAFIHEWVSLIDESRELPPVSVLRQMLRSLDDLEAAWADYWRKPVEQLVLDHRLFRFDKATETWSYLGGQPST